MRFDQCTETCTTDCGHCKGRPVASLRAELNRERGLREFADNWAAWHAKAQADAEAERDRLREDNANQNRIADILADELVLLSGERDDLAAALDEALPKLWTHERDKARAHPTANVETVEGL